MTSTLINLDKYPIDQADSAQYRKVVTNLREALHSKKLLNMEGFLTDDGTRAIEREIDERMPSAFHSVRSGTPYGIVESNDLPDDHPYNIHSDSDRYGLAHHQLQGTLLDKVYRWPPVKRFVGDILGVDGLYLHEDPSNALVVHAYKTHGGLAWHFDRALFSTILNLRESEDGGYFECAPGIRSDTEPRFDDVRDVLLERSNQVRSSRVKPGSFTIMYGRNTLHRVTEVLGTSSRLSAVLSYEDRPGVKLDAATRRLFFGPTAPSED